MVGNISELVNLTGVTMACEDADSKLVEVVNVANVDDLVKILKLMFRQDLKLEFSQYFAADVFVEVTNLNLGRDSEARFGQYLEF